MYPLILFLLIPVLEIWLLVKVGGMIGAGTTVALVVAMAILGGVLVRIQGFAVLSRGRAALAAGEFPSAELYDGLCVLLAGFLLITPGFMTDVLGIVLFIPPMRRWLGRLLWRWLRDHEHIVARRGGATVIEGHYHEVRPTDDSPNDRLTHINHR